jgi:hypothetical protein
MLIMTQDAPPAVTAAFVEGLSSLLAGPGRNVTREHYVGEMTRAPTLEELGGPLDRAILHHPQPVYSLGLKAAAGNDSAAGISAAGWRCFAGGSKRTIVMGRVTQRGPDEWKMSSVNYGDWPWAILEATRSLEKLPEVKAATKTVDYELRVLTVAALSTEAFWLKSLAKGATDLLIPFHSPVDAKRRLLDEVSPLPHYLEWIRPQALTILHGRGDGPRAV